MAYIDEDKFLKGFLYDLEQTNFPRKTFFDSPPDNLKSSEATFIFAGPPSALGPIKEFQPAQVFPSITWRLLSAEVENFHAYLRVTWDILFMVPFLLLTCGLELTEEQKTSFFILYAYTLVKLSGHPNLGKEFGELCRKVEKFYRFAFSKNIQEEEE